MFTFRRQVIGEQIAGHKRPVNGENGQEGHQGGSGVGQQPSKGQPASDDDGDGGYSLPVAKPAETTQVPPEAKAAPATRGPGRPRSGGANVGDDGDDNREPKRGAASKNVGRTDNNNCDLALEPQGDKKAYGLRRRK